MVIYLLIRYDNQLTWTHTLFNPNLLENVKKYLASRVITAIHDKVDYIQGHDADDYRLVMTLNRLPNTVHYTEYHNTLKD